MRKRLRIVLLAVFVAAIVVPLGFSLSLESEHRTTAASRRVEPVSQVLISRSEPVASTVTISPWFTDVPEGAKLFGIGTALFALAAAMRKGSRSSS